jgi:hypothetical protein
MGQGGTDSSKLEHFVNSRQCWSTNVMHHVQLMRAAAPIFKANPDGGVYLMTLSVAVCGFHQKGK